MVKSKRLADRLPWAVLPLTAFHAYDPRLRRTRFPGPYRLQIQTVDRCNGRCVMCPYVGSDGPARLMDGELYTRILRQAAEAGHVRKFDPILRNEPLLDPGLSERVRAAREILGPRTDIGVVTNGSTLSDDRIRGLVDAGATGITVSLDAYRRQTYEAIRPGLDFDRVRANTRALLRYAGRITTGVSFLAQQLNRAEEDAFRRYWRSQGATVTVQEVVNRAGALRAYEQVYARRTIHWRDLVHDLARSIGGRLYPACALPFATLAVLVDGRAVACCHDWGPREVVGDLSREALDDVWNGKEMNRIRQLLVERRFERSAACADCSVVMQCGPGAGRQ
jgi:radical SAM protein with 4Fe4S-binding SPASM domain